MNLEYNQTRLGKTTMIKIHKGHFMIKVRIKMLIENFYLR